ncbi:nitrous oxide reductase accessory protein NosL [Undibacterium macrobrachii]|jgi:copper chaperone NosL|uniref:Nitrous oxide reductase accessory protein NosL n=1 Tax=Undibacterium macrobrachii TaxID=1119058 RepID=A0ABQ2XEB7_9BURK|nr:nitrous oxide reductase accessory protein NosL [Undibacterium macrobrachii]
MNQHRRSFIVRSFLFSMVGGSLIACKPSTSNTSIAPVEIDSRTTCDLDGMLLADYPGPKAQVFYVGNPTPRFFCDTVELLNTLLSPEQVQAVAAAFVQDMGKADWDQPRGNWIPVNTAYYVLGSKRHGSMGPTIASFSLEADAQKFIAQWNGKLMRYADIKPEMVDLSGGALHDTKM